MFDTFTKKCTRNYTAAYTTNVQVWGFPDFLCANTKISCAGTAGSYVYKLLAGRVIFHDIFVYDFCSIMGPAIVVINSKDACWVIYSCFWCSLLTFFEIIFFKKLFQEHYQCQMVWIQIRTDTMSVLIWLKQFAKVISSRDFPTFLKSKPGACWIWEKAFGPSKLGKFDAV